MNIYFLSDGLCEDYHALTSLEKTCHPYLDRLFTDGEARMFEPVQANNMFHPATYFIFPHFFGMKPDLNPGRAALELIENGIDIIGYSSFALFRVINSRYDVRNGWYEKTEPLPLDIVEPIINRVGQEKYLGRKRSKIVKSRLSHNIWCIGSESEDSLEYTLNVLQYEFSKYNLNVYSTLIHNVCTSIKSPQASATSKHLLGWMVGPTAQALSLIGVDINDQKCHTPEYVFDFERKTHDFHSRILPKLKECELAGKDDDFIIYIKETSTAAKKNMADKKLLSISFLDGLIGAVFNELNGGNTNVILISDHQSNIGIPYVFPGPSFACVLNMKNLSKKETEAFTEKNIINKTGSVLSQSECVSFVNNSISKCPYHSTRLEQSSVFIEKARQQQNRKFLFLDRDGVINDDIGTYILNEGMLHLKEGAIAAMAKASVNGWIVNICTNQPGIGKGLMSHFDLDLIHSRIRKEVEDNNGRLGEIIYCIHARGSSCPNRKPEAGMLFHLAKEYQMTEEEIKNSWLVGDHVRDYKASQLFGCKFAWITNNPDELNQYGLVESYPSLYEFVLSIVNN